MHIHTWFTEIHGGYRTIRQADDDQRGYRFGDGNEYAEAKNLDKRLAVAPRRGSLHESEHFEGNHISCVMGSNTLLML